MAPKLFTKNDLPTKHFVNNKWVSGTGEAIELKNPKDESLISKDLHTASASDVDKAVDYATEAFETGPWSTFSGEKRGICLGKLADLIEEHADEIAYFESIASGRPLMSTQRDVPMSAQVFRYYAGWADKIKGDSFPADDGFYKLVSQEALGVCAGITAWNGSLHFLAWKAAPALACGNTSIIKPSEKSPFGTLAVGYLIEAAGFPPGAFQIIAGAGATGALLASHMKIAKISFTGSTATGRKIQDAATKSNLKRVTLELGGKSPAIIFDDADLEKAIFWSIVGITNGTGQVCAATSRVYVQNSIMPAFLAAMKQAFEGISGQLGGDPQDPSTTYGPVVDKLQYDRVRTYIESGKKNAELLTGGDEYQKSGHYISPTIFVNPADDAAVYKEEIFGPVLCVKPFETEEEVLKMANNSQYGLAGAVFTKDLARALRVSSKVRAGTVCVNCALMVGPQAPMGGFKMSGNGRELGEYALRHYTETKTVWISAQ